RDRVRGPRRDRAADVLLVHPGSKMAVDDGHTVNPGQRLSIRVRCEFAQPFETLSERVSARQSVPSSVLDPSEITEDRSDPLANLVRRDRDIESRRVILGSSAEAIEEPDQRVPDVVRRESDS